MMFQRGPYICFTIYSCSYHSMDDFSKKKKNIEQCGEFLSFKMKLVSFITVMFLNILSSDPQFIQVKYMSINSPT